MRNVSVRNVSKRQRGLRATIIGAISLVVLLLGACNMGAVPGQNSSIVLADAGDLDARRQGGTSGGTSSSTLAVDLGAAASFAVLGGTTVTNAGASVLNGDLGVSPGTAITGFQPTPINTIEGPGTVTAGLGVVSGTIYASGPVAAQAHNDAVIAYNYLVAQAPDTIYAGVTQLDNMTFTPGVYNFAPSANLQVNGVLTLDFQGNSDALFIFQLGTTLVTMAGSKVVAINTGGGTDTCVGANVYWAVGSSATIDGSEFVGTVIAYTTITMTSAGNIPATTLVAGRMLALGGAVTMVDSMISVCGTTGGGTDPGGSCKDFVTGGGWLDGNAGYGRNNKATFGVSGGIKNGDFWGQLSFIDHGRNGVQVKSTEVTAYIVIDAVTRQIEGIAKVNGRGSFTYTAIVADNGEPGGGVDTFSLVVSNGYSVSGTISKGNIQLHRDCEPRGHYDGDGCGDRHGDKDDRDDDDRNGGRDDDDDDRNGGRDDDDDDDRNRGRDRD